MYAVKGMSDCTVYSPETGKLVEVLLCESASNARKAKRALVAAGFVATSWKVSSRMQYSHGTNRYFHTPYAVYANCTPEQAVEIIASL